MKAVEAEKNENEIKLQSTPSTYASNFFGISKKEWNIFA